MPEVPLPRQLFDVDQHKIIALVIDPVILAKIRAIRVAKLGVSSTHEIDYAAMQVCCCIIAGTTTCSQRCSRAAAP